MNQHQWETDAYNEGMEKFFDDEAKARLDGKTDETKVGSAVLKQRVLAIGDMLREGAAKKTNGIGGAYVQALRVAATRYNGKEFYQDYNIPAYIGLMALLQVVYSRNKNLAYLSNVAVEIGRRLEYDQQLYVFRQDHPAFVGKIEASLAQQGVTSLRHKLKTFQKKWRDADMVWESWGVVKQTQVGLRVLRAILTEMDDCFFRTKRHNGKHARHYLDTTLEFDDFVIDETDLLSKTMPVKRPMVEPPIDWERVDGEVIGGFHTPELRSQNLFIKTKGEDHKEFVEQAYPYKHITAVNHMQRTAWKVNDRVAELVEAATRGNWEGFGLPRHDKLELPEYPEEGTDEEKLEWMVVSKSIHGKNKQNISELIVLGQSLKMIDKLDGRDFWFTYTCDFRGRIYCSSSTLSPQGPDHIKGMITFSEGKALGREGIRWLAINGANKYGYDKVDYNDRVRWVVDQRSAIDAFVSDPTSSESRSFLAGADKPFQFAAFCFEWADAKFGTDPSTVSHLPIGLDGSCNGLQHYGALLLDDRGGRSVNLADSELPNDIYGDVASEFRRLLGERAGDDMARAILRLNPDRKCTKRPVMTLPYGATQQSCRAYLLDWLEDQVGTGDRKVLWPMAVYATPILWEAIGNVVVAARQGMAWLQQCSSLIANAGIFARWLSPADFPVYQHYCEHESIAVSTDLFGRIQLFVQGESTGEILKHRARNGIAPNFVHALDSSHMVFSILEAAGRGMTSMSMIHDDFGVHACDTPEFFDAIRVCFVRMYSDRDWLLSWKKEMERLHDGLELPEPPEKGTLDITQVLDSKYFFG